MSNKFSIHSKNQITYYCQYHVIWTPKYRRNVLVDGVETRLRQIIQNVADELDFDIIELEITTHSVSMVCSVNPQFGIHRFVKRIKAESSRILRTEFDWLNSRLPSLWTNAYLVFTIGQASDEYIKQYIDNQKDI